MTRETTESFKVLLEEPETIHLRLMVDDAPIVEVKVPKGTLACDVLKAACPRSPPLDPQIQGHRYVFGDRLVSRSAVLDRDGTFAVRTVSAKEAEQTERRLVAPKIDPDAVLVGTSSLENDVADLLMRLDDVEDAHPRVRAKYRREARRFIAVHRMLSGRR